MRMILLYSGQMVRCRKKEGMIWEPGNMDGSLDFFIHLLCDLEFPHLPETPLAYLWNGDANSS